MTILGIDPGKAGACALLDGEEAHVLKMPLDGDGGVDVVKIAQWWSGILQGGPAFTVVERQQVFPKQGACSAFTLGTGYGQLLGMLRSRYAPLQIVRAKDWQRQFSIVRRRGAPKTDTKRQSIQRAHDLFPAVDIGRHDGIADALLIAEYGRRLRAGT